MSKPEFLYMTYIASTPDKVWQALTDGKFTQQYWGGRAIDSDWQVGSPVVFRRTNANNAKDVVRGRVLEIEPPKKLVLSWAYELELGKPITPASKVTFLVEDVGSDNVKLTVTHEVWEEGSLVDDGLIQGWSAILSSLKSFLETGDGLGITKQWYKEGK